MEGHRPTFLTEAEAIDFVVMGYSASDKDQGGSPHHLTDLSTFTLIISLSFCTLFLRSSDATRVQAGQQHKKPGGAGLFLKRPFSDSREFSEGYEDSCLQLKGAAAPGELS